LTHIGFALSENKLENDGQSLGPDGAYLIDRAPSEEESRTRSQELRDKEFKENQINTNDRLVILNCFLVLATLATASISIWQINVSREVSRAARKQSDQNALDASRQFQVQLGHFDAGMGRTELLAKHAGEQADDAATMARNSGIQASANRRAADAAKTAADTASKALHVSERAYLSVGFAKHRYRSKDDTLSPRKHWTYSR
jgi:hypothetical protein